MTIEIDVVNGNAGWPAAKPLFDAVWPPHVVEKSSWASIVFAHPELRVLIQSETEGTVAHVGIYRRAIKWNGRTVPAGGIGGVSTRPDLQRRGYASLALNAAVETLRHEGSAAFALLFCEPHNAPFYMGRGWKRFDGEIYIDQPAGRVRFEAMDPYVYSLKHAPTQGVLDLCGPPW
jgi:aminoglycoside 2'-N-acetyltransferase I